MRGVINVRLQHLRPQTRNWEGIYPKILKFILYAGHDSAPLSSQPPTRTHIKTHTKQRASAFTQSNLVDPLSELSVQARPWALQIEPTLGSSRKTTFFLRKPPCGTTHAGTSCLCGKGRPAVEPTYSKLEVPVQNVERLESLSGPDPSLHKALPHICFKTQQRASPPSPRHTPVS